MGPGAGEISHGFGVWPDRKRDLLKERCLADADLEQAEQYFKEQGLPVEWVDKPYMGRTLKTRDPDGIPLEFYALMDRLPSLHQQYKLYNGVKPLRIDHFNMFSANVDDSVGFYNEL